ncbi:MAG: hypothetical protein WAQ05_02745 [Rubrivivax sp.]
MKRLLPTVAALLLAPTAFAGTVVFTLDGADLPAAASYTETASGYSVTAQAYTSYGGSAFLSSEVRRMGDALGVTSVGDLNGGQIDDSGGSVEALLFDFGSSGFAGLDIAFTLLGIDESMNIWWGNTLDLSSTASPLENQASNPATSGNPPDNPFSIAAFGGARYLMIGAVDNGPSSPLCGPVSGNSCFRVDSLTATVPEPGSLALVLAAALGLAVVSPRRRGVRASAR